MNEAIYNQIKDTVHRQSRDAQIRHTAFASIRNKATVRAAMDKLGFSADCDCKPNYWTKKPEPKIVKGVIETKPVQLMKDQSKKDQFRKLLFKEGVIYLADVKASEAYAQRIASLLRVKEGLNVEPIFKGLTAKNRKRLVGYRLISKQ
ncbi:hypothetical protein ACS8E2_05475 [Psychrobacter glaciei]|uniref:hypothetical protein n=1 Tax=Psychrobacter glaciei TaxID=619771 RepID=UPI003F48541F